MAFSVLILCEKKTQAEMFKKGLNLNQSKSFDGAVCYYDSLTGIGVAYESGHVLELAPPHYYIPSLEKSWSLEQLPFRPDTFKLDPIPGKFQRALFSACKWAMVTNGTPAEIAIATDDDKEGDLLGYELLEYLKVHNKCKLTRLRYRQISVDVQIKAFHERGPFAPFMNRMLSAMTRRNYDWLIGMQFTMGLSVCNRHLIPPGEVFNSGRVIFGMLYILVEHHRRIKNFIPARYFQIKAMYKKADDATPQPVLFKASLQKNDANLTYDACTGNSLLSDENIANSILNIIQGTPSTTISAVEKKNTITPPPLGFNRSAADKLLGDRLSIDMSQSDKILQKMYDTYGLTTYPRSEEKGLDEDDYNKMPAVIEAIKTNIINSNKINPALKKYYIDNIFPRLDLSLKAPIFVMKRDDDPEGKNKKKKKEEIESSHTAIRPTETVYPLDEIEDTCRAAYLLFADRILMQFLGDAHDAKLKAQIDLADNVTLLIRGTAPRVKGWRLLRTRDEESKEKDPEDNDGLPDLNKGDVVELVSAQMNEAKTEPEKYLTQQELGLVMESPRKYVKDMSKLEAEGISLSDLTIGTSATRKEHVLGLIAKRFVIPFEDKNERSKVVRWMPSSKAMAVNALSPEFLRYPETSSVWERHFKLMDEGKMTPSDFESRVWPLIVDYVEKCKAGKLTLSKSPFPNSPCGHVLPSGVACSGFAFRLLSKEKNTPYWQCRTCRTNFSDVDGQKGNPLSSSPPAPPPVAVENAPQIACPDCANMMNKFSRQKRDDPSRTYFLWICGHCKAQFFDKNGGAGSRLGSSPNNSAKPSSQPKTKPDTRKKTAADPDKKTVRKPRKPKAT